MEMNEEEIQKEVLARVAEEEALYPRKTVENGAGKLSSVYLRQCLRANQLGLGLLYAALLKDRLIYDNSAGEWLHWAGHCWQRDIMQTAYAATEDVVDRLLEESLTVSEQITWAAKKGDKDRVKELDELRNLIFKRVAFLRDDRGRNACIKFSRTCRDPIAIKGDEKDKHPLLLACANGVLDLRIGELRPGRPEDFITRAAPTAWKGLREPAPRFEAWIREVLSNDDELVAFLQRLLGYGITGLNIEHHFFIFYGSGRNGKGTLITLIIHVLGGDLARPIQAEMLLDQGRTRSSAGPSPDLMALNGLRLAFGSETEENRRFAVSRVKLLCGGDMIVARDLQSGQCYFSPTHTLILSTNHRPSAPASDFAFWSRVLLVPFDLAFVDRDPIAPNERRMKKGLEHELKEEASGILAWLVRGCLAYQERGLDPPKSVTEATAQYRRHEDILADFLEERCTVGEFSEASAKNLYDAFCTWSKENWSERVVLTQRKFGELLAQRFERYQKQGRYYYRGVEVV